MKKSAGRPSRTFSSIAPHEERTDRPRETRIQPSTNITRHEEKKSGKSSAILRAAAALAIVLAIALIWPCRKGKKARFGPAARDGVQKAVQEHSEKKKERLKNAINRFGDANAGLPAREESAHGRASDKRTPDLGTEIEIIEPK